MKYDVTIDPDDTGTSHGLVIELVGSDKRVLDVGCSSGYLAEALAQRGNTVSGVEVDAEAAEVARSRVQKLVIGDLETLDLVEEFGEKSFDVVIFADVLEHLTNPLGVLRAARPLLAEGGCVIVSLPNVAHGAVRLALLRGNFEYRELGLLDDTHLRFFTRTTVDELLHQAGFVATDIRRTTAEPFDTEIPLNASDFDPGVIEALRRDPEATTYQFIMRAVPLGSVPSEVAIVNDLTAKGLEIERLRAEMEALVQPLAQTTMAPRLGLIAGDPISPLGRLRMAALNAEMLSRLGSFDIRTFSLSSEPEEIGVAGEVAHPLLPWTDQRSTTIHGEVDAIVVVCSLESKGREPLRTIVKDLGVSGLPVHFLVTDAPMGSSTLDPMELADPWSRRPSAATNGQVTVDPQGILPSVADPSILSRRLFSAPLLKQRLDYLSVTGQLRPGGRFVVGSFSDPAVNDDDLIWKALDVVARRMDAEIVLIPGDSGEPFANQRGEGHGHSSLRDLDPFDLLAVLGGAAGVITDTPAMLSLATVLGTPAVGVVVGQTTADERFVEWAKSQRLSVTDAQGLVATMELSLAARDQPTDQLSAGLEAFLDDLADSIMFSTGRRLSLSIPQRIAELVDQVNVLEAANAGLRRSLSRERLALAAEADAYRSYEDVVPVIDSERLQRVADRKEYDEALQEIARLRFELDAIYGTRTMRTVAPARRVYSKLRSLRQ